MRSDPAPFPQSENLIKLIIDGYKPSRLQIFLSVAHDNGELQVSYRELYSPGLKLKK